MLGGVVSAGAAAAGTVVATAGHSAPTAAPATIQIGFAGAVPQAVTPLAPTAAPPPPPAAAADDPQTAWLQRVAQGGQAPVATNADAATSVAATPAAQAPPPAPLSLQEASRAVHVVVYTTGWCPHCKRAKAWMNGNGVAYEERNIESSAEYAQENRRINPRGSIPTFDVDGDVMTGFAENDLAALILRAARKRSASP